MIQATPYRSLTDVVAALEDLTQCSLVTGVEREFALRACRSSAIPDRDHYLTALGEFGGRVVAERHNLQVEFNGSTHSDLRALIAEHDEAIAKMSVAAATLGYRLDTSCSLEPPCSLQVSCSLWKSDVNKFAGADGSLDLASDSPLTRCIAGLLASYEQHRTHYCGDAANCMRRCNQSKESVLFVPRYNAWSVNNRAAAYRVCYVQDAPSRTRLENRVACSSADLATCLHSTLTSILAGWSNDICLDVKKDRLFGIVDPKTSQCLQVPL